MDDEIGLDADAIVYEMDKETNFQLDDGTILKGQPLIDHLIHTNEILKNKIHVYCRKCNDLKEALFEEKSHTYKKLQNVHSFYRDNYDVFGKFKRGYNVKIVLYVINEID